ncbi:MAG: sulfotransferase family 2 domain-containing protein [Opitutales bacterium]
MGPRKPMVPRAGEGLYQLAQAFQPSRRLKYVFVHIPKTAGTSFLRGFIQPHEPHFKYAGHAWKEPQRVRGWGSWMDPSRAEQWDWLPGYGHHLAKGKPAISIVRNPFDLLVSYYFHGAVEKNHLGWANVINIHGFRSFREFILAYCDPNFTWHLPALKQRLFGQLFDSSGVCLASLIIRQEELAEGLRQFARLHEMADPETLPAVRPSLSREFEDYRFYYDSEMVELLTRKLHPDLEAFDYAFES